MQIVHVHVHVKPEFVEAFRAATLENARNSVQEPGVVRFDVIQQEDDPTRFILVEIYRDDEALPPAFVVPRARVVADPDERLAALLDPAFDPRAEVLLSRAPARPPAPAQRDTTPPTFSEPSVLREGPNRVIIQVNMAQSGYLVLTDTFYPGWRATVDGEAVEILPADHAFRAVGLEAGEHTVVFEYAPLSFRVGAWVSLGAGVLLVATLVVGCCVARPKSLLFAET